MARTFSFTGLISSRLIRFPKHVTSGNIVTVYLHTCFDFKKMYTFHVNFLLPFALYHIVYIVT